MSRTLRIGVLSQSGEPPSTIVVDFSDSTTTVTDTTSQLEVYKQLVITGRQAGDIISLSFEWDAVEDEGDVEIHWSKNSTVSWTLLVRAIGTGGSSGNMTSIDDDDVIRVKITLTLDNPASGEASCTMDLTGGSVTTGTGTVTASGTTNWSESLLGS